MTGRFAPPLNGHGNNPCTKDKAQVVLFIYPKRSGAKENLRLVYQTRNPARSFGHRIGAVSAAPKHRNQAGRTSHTEAAASNAEIVHCKNGDGQTKVAAAVKKETGANWSEAQSSRESAEGAETEKEASDASPRPKSSTKTGREGETTSGCRGRRDHHGRHPGHHPGHRDRRPGRRHHHPRHSRHAHHRHRSAPSAAALR